MNPETNRLEPLQQGPLQEGSAEPPPNRKMRRAQAARQRHEPKLEVPEHLRAIARRARVQGVAGPGPNRRPSGSISWEEHEQAWRAYAKLYGEIQSAERINDRGGFGYEELTGLLGHPPKTWRPSRAISGETTEP